ncbi:MAG: NUDIX hydrolase [Lachnospiraceae bacterium]|nr:NUDIX hydrolase [Lachnospiraceae bacterium]
MELWDAYDEDLNKIKNMALIRGERIPNGIFHLVCDIIVKHTDESYLLMQRDSRKNFGGMWEATAGGSALQNETPLQCAIRELREETGIYAGDLIEVGRVIDYSNNSIYVEFLCITNCDKDSVTLQPGETVAYKWVSKDELVAMKKDELVTERMQKFIEELQV